MIQALERGVTAEENSQEFDLLSCWQVHLQSSLEAKKRCQSVDMTVKTTAPTPKSKMTKDDLADTWTPKHDKELKFNEDKRAIRLYESLKAGVVKPEDVTIDVLRGAVKHFQAQELCACVCMQLCKIDHWTPPVPSVPPAPNTKRQL